MADKLTQSNFGVYGRAQQTARRWRSQAPKVAQPTVGRAADPVVNYRFQPVVDMPEAVADQEEIERCFMDCLTHFERLYKVNIRRGLESVPYPFRIALMLDRVREMVNKREGYQTRSARIIQDENRGPAVLVTTEEWMSRHIFFWIPIQPVWEAHRYLDKGLNQRKETVELCLSVLHYLRYWARVPSQSDDGCCTGSNLQAIIDNYDEEGDAGESFEERFPDHFNFAGAATWQLEKAEEMDDEVLLNGHGEQFNDRTRRYKAYTRAERTLRRVARGFLRLLHEHPGRTVWDNLCKTEPDEDGDRIDFSYVLGFVWSIDDEVTCEIESMANHVLSNSLNNELPEAYQFFDSPQETVHHDFSFEDRFFDLVEQFRWCLTDLFYYGPKVKPEKRR